MSAVFSILTARDYQEMGTELQVLRLANDAEVDGIALEGVRVIELNFPKFTDGRAYTQAYTLRRRRGFQGEIRAVGDVLIDQLVQMQRTGFSSAVLRADQDIAHARRQFDRFPGYYQADAAQPNPLFARGA